jgi:hypothetical protein
MVVKKLVPKKNVAKKEIKEPSQISVRIPGPDELNIPPEKLTDYCICIYGTKGIGKTSLAASFPNSFTTMFEPRRRNLSIRMQQLGVPDLDKVKASEADEWEIFKQYLALAEEDDTVSNVVVDTIDLAYTAALLSVSVRNGYDHPSQNDKDYGRTWGKLSQEVALTFDTFRQNGKGLIFISHTKERDIEVVDGSTAKMVSPSAPPACIQYLKQACDFAFFYGYFLGKRALVLRDNEGSIWTGCGVTNRFMQPNGKPLNILEMPDDPKLGYQRLNDAFNNKCWDITTPEDERTTETVSRKPLKKS